MLLFQGFNARQLRSSQSAWNEWESRTNATSGYPENAGEDRQRALDRRPSDASSSEVGYQSLVRWMSSVSWKGGSKITLGAAQVVRNELAKGSSGVEWVALDCALIEVGKGGVLNWMSSVSWVIGDFA